jgi:hypothetical protein
MTLASQSGCAAADVVRSKCLGGWMSKPAKRGFRSCLGHSPIIARMLSLSINTLTLHPSSPDAHRMKRLARQAVPRLKERKNEGLQGAAPAGYQPYRRRRWYGRFPLGFLSGRRAASANNSAGTGASQAGAIQQELAFRHYRYPHAVERSGSGNARVRTSTGAHLVERRCKQRWRSGCFMG